MDAWIMTTGLAVVGASYVLTAAGLPTSRWARAVLALGGAATIAVATSPQPDAAHAPAATIAFLALAIWPVFTAGRTRWLTPALLVLLAWFAIALATTSDVGLSERVLAGAEALTPLVIAAATRRQPEATRAA